MIGVRVGLDPASPVPLYYQLQTVLTRQIRERQLRPGDQLPGELELCEQYGVSRTVVRSALQELAHRGLIDKRRGVGSFVSPPKISERLFQGVGGVHDEMASRGLKLRTEVLDLSRVPVDGQIAEHLALADGDEVHRLVRRRFVEDEPLLVGTTHIPVRLVPEIDLEWLRTGSLYQLLRDRHGIVLAQGRRTFESVGADEEDAELLQVPVGAPLSLIRSVGSTANGDPVEYFESLHRGDRAVFEVSVVTSDTSGQANAPALGVDGAVSWSALSGDLTV